MIAFFVGTPGSGKSYEAVKKIVDNLKLGRTVCTNIDGMDQPQCQEYMKSVLDMDDYTFRQRFRFLDREQVKRFWRSEKIINLTYSKNDDDVFEDVTTEVDELICPKGSLIVLDEVHKFFNARDWNVKDEDGRNVNREFGDWASTHRHEGYDLVLITQDIEKVDKQVRSLTEWCYFFRKVNFLGGAVQKKYLCYAYSGDDHNGKPLSKNVRTYHPDYFKCYQSYSSADAKEVGFMSHTNILKHPVFYAIPVVLCFCLYMFFSKSSFASGDLFGVTKVQHKYDNVATPGMKKQAAAQTFKNISSTLPVKPGLLPPALAGGTAPAFSFPQVIDEFSKYKVDGYIIDDGKTIISINGIPVRLPSAFVKMFNKDSGTAHAKTDIFGPPAVPSSRSPLPPPVTMPLQSSQPEKAKIAKSMHEPFNLTVADNTYIPAESKTVDIGKNYILSK